MSNDFKSEAHVCDAREKGVDFIEEVFENVTVRIPDCIQTGTNLTKDLVVMAVYRQPDSSNVDSFLTHLETLMTSFDRPNNELIFAGDINLDLIKYAAHAQTARYLDIMTSYRTLPRIVRPTRIKHQSATLIDHIFTRHNPLTIISGILDIELAGSAGFTDHKPVFTIIKADVPKKETRPITTLSYFTKQGHLKRKEGLRQQDWDETLNLTDPDAIYDQITEIYSHHYFSNITKKSVKWNSRQHRREPWMTDEILADIRRRDRLVKLKNRRTDYKKLRNEIVSKVRKAERSYLAKQVQDSVGDIKKHWNILKKVINKTDTKDDVTSEFLVDGMWIKDNQQNATRINAYFASIGRETNESVGQTNLSAYHLLQTNKARNEHFLPFNKVYARDIIEVCKLMTPKTSMDPHGLKQSIILDDAEILAPILCHLVNSSMKAGKCPQNSKLAKVIPVYIQKGSKHLYTNYRPISLLSTFSKIMERLIYDKLFDFLVRYDILFESQFGFRKGHNTTHATLDFVRTIEDALEKGEYAVGVFCDLSKAFDTIDHDILLAKLDHYGIRGCMLEWLKSYLNSRQQYVEFNGCKSNASFITTGVPQGSILGPLLFIIYINDLPCCTKLHTVKFADDSNFVIKGKDLPSLSETLNIELRNVDEFFKANKLKLNAKKTKLVCFRRKGRDVNLDDYPVYLDNEKLDFEEETTFLGMRLDSHLTWDKHCQHVANTISKNNGVLSRAKKLLPTSSLRLLYNSLILPHLQYGLAAWGGCSGQNKKRIINIQKRAIRTICKSYVSSHTEPRMKALCLLKLEDLYTQQCATLVHDIINKRAPIKIASLISLSCDTQSQRLRSQSSNPLLVREQLGRCKVSSCSFRVKGPTCWNCLPIELQSVTGKTTFKSQLRKHLIAPYQTSLVCTNPRCTDRRHHH